MKKIRRLYRENRADIYQTTTYFLISGIGIITAMLLFEKERFHQVEAAVEDLGLTDTIVDHMLAHGPY